MFRNLLVNIRRRFLVKLQEEHQTMNVKNSVKEESESFDEKLAKVVKQYPCLYDNSSTDYRDKFIVANVWDTVADEMQLDGGNMDFLSLSGATAHRFSMWLFLKLPQNSNQ